MDIVIDHGVTRRRIKGNFNIIGSEQDLREIADQILMKLGKDGEITFAYGTVYITEHHHGVPNKAPKEWDE